MIILLTPFALEIFPLPHLIFVSPGLFTLLLVKRKLFILKIEMHSY